MLFVPRPIAFGCFPLQLSRRVGSGYVVTDRAVGPSREPAGGWDEVAAATCTKETYVSVGNVESSEEEEALGVKNWKLSVTEEVSAKFVEESVIKRSLGVNEIVTEDNNKRRKKEDEQNLMPEDITVKSKRYQCQDCPKTFPQPSNLKQHHLDVHTKDRPYQCGICLLYTSPSPRDS